MMQLSLQPPHRRAFILIYTLSVMPRCAVSGASIHAGRTLNAGSGIHIMEWPRPVIARECC